MRYKKNARIDFFYETILLLASFSSLSLSSAIVNVMNSFSGIRRASSPDRILRFAISDPPNPGRTAWETGKDAYAEPRVSLRKVSKDEGEEESREIGNPLGYSSAIKEKNNLLIFFCGKCN